MERCAFYDCQDLRSVEVQEGVERIDKYCFSYSGVEEISLPGSLKELDQDAFAYCDHLRIVKVDPGCALDIRKYVKESVEVRHK